MSRSSRQRSRSIIYFRSFPRCILGRASSLHQIELESISPLDPGNGLRFRKSSWCLAIASTVHRRTSALNCDCTSTSLPFTLWHMTHRPKAPQKGSPHSAAPLRSMSGAGAGGRQVSSSAAKCGLFTKLTNPSDPSRTKEGPPPQSPPLRKRQKRKESPSA